MATPFLAPTVIVIALCLILGKYSKMEGTHVKCMHANPAYSGFKYIFLEEAKKFLKEDDDRVLYNTLVTKIEYDQNGVAIQTNTSDVILADYAITTFS